MRRPVIFTDATPDDAAELAAGMRSFDAREMALYAGLCPSEGVALSCYTSDAVFAGRARGSLLALFGVYRDSVISRSAVIWALGTRQAEISPVDFLSGSRKGLDLAMSAIPDAESFYNWSLDDNSSSRRWLDWLGAFWTHDVMVTPFGGTFRRFVIGR